MVDLGWSAALSREEGEKGCFDAMDGSFESMAADTGVTLAAKETVLGVSVSQSLFWIELFGVGRACNGFVVNRIERILVPTTEEGM